MDKTVVLKDGTEVTIRSLKKEDADKFWAFFKKLPSADRVYLRNDVTDRDVVHRRIRELKQNREKALIAVAGERIVADGSLELETHGWKKHIGEIRLVVAHPYQRKGLGMLMARELYLLAASEKVEEIVVKMMRPQAGAQKIFKRLGFHEDVRLPHYDKDLKGARQDLIIMRCDLASLWKELEDYFTETDWQRRK